MFDALQATSRSCKTGASVSLLFISSKAFAATLVQTNWFFFIQLMTGSVIVLTRMACTLSESTSDPLAETRGRDGTFFKIYVEFLSPNNSHSLLQMEDMIILSLAVD